MSILTHNQFVAVMMQYIQLCTEIITMKGLILVVFEET